MGLNSIKGRELVSLIQDEIPPFMLGLGLKCIINPIIYSDNSSQYNMFKASMEDDLVLFDGSIEIDGDGSWDSNYIAATAQPCAQDNILVLSRTRLPLNFPVMRTNVPELGVNDKNSNGEPILYFENTEIVIWLKNEISLMATFTTIGDQTFSPRIPVCKKFRTIVPPFEELNKLDSNFFEIQKAKMADAIEFINATKRKGAFISYRSHYYKTKYKGLVTAQDLASKIKEIHNDPDYPVTLYAEGDIANEFMTEQRMWFVEGFVEQKLRLSEEVWIFETDNEDGYSYYNSWWTQGEIIALMYIKASGAELPKIYVYSYDSHSGEMKYELKDSSFIPDLTKDAVKELSRYFSNSSGTFESMRSMREIRKLDAEQQYSYYKMIKQMSQQFLSLGIDNSTSKEFEYDYDSFMESVYSHVYDRSFVENRIVMLPNYTEVTIDCFKNSQFIKQYICINSVRDDKLYKDDIENRGYVSISPEHMDNIDKTHEFKWGTISKQIQRINYSQFYWWPLRSGMRTGPNGVIIELIKNWEFINK
ncbi:MAG: hypothetical protein IJA34_08460 [Lachnospiraceae bacterium]|nr:hypothetical protein [Lachnospiraceae bacterium]